jgi:hypothetical protein
MKKNEVIKDLTYDYSNNNKEILFEDGMIVLS